jgi:hypothetical protein
MSSHTFNALVFTICTVSSLIPKGAVAPSTKWETPFTGPVRIRWWPHRIRVFRTSRMSGAQPPGGMR